MVVGDTLLRPQGQCRLAVVEVEVLAERIRLVVEVVLLRLDKCCRVVVVGRMPMGSTVVFSSEV